MPVSELRDAGFITWDVTPPAGVSFAVHCLSLLDALRVACNYLVGASGASHNDAHLIHAAMPPEMAQFARMLPTFVPYTGAPSDPRGGGHAWMWGTISVLNQYTIVCHKLRHQNQHMTIMLFRNCWIPLRIVGLPDGIMNPYGPRPTPGTLTAVVPEGQQPPPDNRSAAWFTGTCRTCGYPVIWQSACRDANGNESEFDYTYYCSRIDCVHAHPDSCYDMEEPSWVDMSRTRPHEPRVSHADAGQREGFPMWLALQGRVPVDGQGDRFGTKPEDQAIAQPPNQPPMQADEGEEI